FVFIATIGYRIWMMARVSTSWMFTGLKRGRFLSVVSKRKRNPRRALSEKSSLTLQKLTRKFRQKSWNSIHMPQDELLIGRRAHNSSEGCVCSLVLCVER